MTACKHRRLVGDCSRCDIEVDTLVQKIDTGGKRITTADLKGLNHSQREDLDTLLLARSLTTT